MVASSVSSTLSSLSSKPSSASMASPSRRTTEGGRAGERGARRVTRVGTGRRPRVSDSEARGQAGYAASRGDTRCYLKNFRHPGKSLALRCGGSGLPVRSAFQASPGELRSRSMARPSRPPGFDMTYRPAETTFGPPFRARLPSLLYVFAAGFAVMIVIAAERSPVDSWLYVNVVERGVRGLIGARTLAFLLALGAIASVLRANMRGVRVHG